MLKHEPKSCPGCQQLFECKSGTLELCQCAAIYLNQEERDYIQQLYEDCLCIDCLKNLKTEFHKLKHQQNLEKISPLFNRSNKHKN